MREQRTPARLRSFAALSPGGTRGNFLRESFARPGRSRTDGKESVAQISQAIPRPSARRGRQDRGKRGKRRRRNPLSLRDAFRGDGGKAMEVATPQICDTPFVVLEQPALCTECHSGSRLKNGLCLNCLLQGALETEDLAA